MIKLKRDDNGQYSCVLRSSTMVKYWDKFYKDYDASVYSYIPLSFIFIFNIAIVVKLIRAKLSGGTGSLSLSKTSYSLTVMLVTVCLVFALLTIPYSITYEASSNVSAVSYALVLTALYSNHAINIVFYMAANKRFRAEVIKKLCGKYGQKIQPEITHTDQAEGSTLNNN